MAVALCEARLGRQRCRTKLVESIDAIGRVIFSCPACARKAAGKCRRCPSKVRAKGAWYCQACYLAVKKVRDRHAQSTEDMKRWASEYLQAYHRRQKADPERWARRLAALREGKRRARIAKHGAEYCATHGPGHAGKVLPRHSGKFTSPTRSDT